jgi:sugar lactone lactonase YvrE
LNRWLALVLRILRTLGSCALILIALVIVLDAVITAAAQPRWTDPRTVTTLSGEPYVFGPYRCQPVNGRSEETIFCNPNGIAYDEADGVAFVADTTTHQVRRVDQSGRVTTFVGHDYSIGSTEFRCKLRDGPRSIAELCEPTFLTFDPVARVLYVADQDSIRRIDAAGNVATIVGQKRTDEWWKCRANVSASAPIHLCRPNGVALNPADSSLWVSDSGSILRIDETRRITLIAGGSGWDDSDCKPRDGVGTEAILCNPFGMTFDPEDHKMYFSDGGPPEYFPDRMLIRSVDAAGRVETFAGLEYPPARWAMSDVNAQECRDWDGPRRIAALCGVGQLAISPDGTVYFADSVNEQIRKVDTHGTVSSIAGHYYSFGGRGRCKGIDGAGMYAKLCYPLGLSIDTKHNVLYFTDIVGRQVRMIRL